jgi:phage baseplate assembly protein V
MSSYRRGVVSAVDAKTHRVRVTFPDKQDVESPWLDVLVRDALDDKDFGLPSKGAQVAVLMDEKDESGCVIGALYSKADAPNSPQSEDLRRWTMKDGTVVSYDRNAHKLTIDVHGGDVEVLITGLMKVAGASDFVALAAKCDARFAAIESNLQAHVHPTGVGPSGPGTPPLTPGDSVAASKLRTD